jgi:hypothetical protein
MRLVFSRIERDAPTKIAAFAACTSRKERTVNIKNSPCLEVDRFESNLWYPCKVQTAAESSIYDEVFKRKTPPGGRSVFQTPDFFLHFFKIISAFLSRVL